MLQDKSVRMVICTPSSREFRRLCCCGFVWDIEYPNNHQTPNGSSSFSSLDGCKWGYPPFLDMFLTFWSSFAQQAATQAISNLLPVVSGCFLWGILMCFTHFQYILADISWHIISILWKHIDSTGEDLSKSQTVQNVRSPTPRTVQQLCFLRHCASQIWCPCQFLWCNRWLFPTKELHRCHQAGYHWLQKELHFSAKSVFPESKWHASSLLQESSRISVDTARQPSTGWWEIGFGSSRAVTGLPQQVWQALMFIDALYEKRNVEGHGGEFWTLDSWQECHRIG